LKLGEKAEDVVIKPEQTVERHLTTTTPSSISPYWS
jgi:hypothetical protein